jgi:hypothetical protein
VTFGVFGVERLLARDSFDFCAVDESILPRTASCLASLFS